MLDFNPYNRESEYKKTENPLLVWDMILECCKEKKTFPGWVMDYLEDAAEELVNLSPPKGRMPMEIRDALGFDGKPNKPFEKYREFLTRKSNADFEFKWSVYTWVESSLPPDGKGKTKIYEAAGERFFKNDGDPGNRWKRVQLIYREMVKMVEEVENENRDILNDV